MLDSREFRELLIADVALVRGVASARDVAAAVQRFWEGRKAGEVSVADELAHAARIPREALEPIEAEVNRLVAHAQRNPQLALTRRGGIERSIHLALGEQASRISLALTEGGAGARAPLHTVDPERYTDFLVTGEGGMGVVYLALDTEMNRTVAFKVVRPDAGHRDRSETPESPIRAQPPAHDTPASRTFAELKARFLQEAWVTGGLSHPGIVPVYEMGQTPTGVPYYTMKFVRGKRTLKDQLEGVRGGSVEDRLQLLEPFLKLCDTVAYAHSRGVIHRDLKPENVALGEFGEVVLLDWGLAKLRGREDLAASRWQERVQEFREAGDLRTVAGMVGTPGYMSPEAAVGRIEIVDRKSDVYSLGAMLYEVLTGRLPHEFATYAQYIDSATHRDPVPACEVAADVPKRLSNLVAKCLARERAERPERVEDLAQAVRTWQAASAQEREVEEHLSRARMALDAAEAVHADDRLRQVERAAGSLEQVTGMGIAAVALPELRDRADTLREAGIREREAASGRRLMVRLGVAALVIAAAAGLVGTALFRAKEKETERERTRSERALADVLRLADAKKARDLEDEASALSPLQADLLSRVEGWGVRVGALTARAQEHEDALRRLRDQMRGDGPLESAVADARDWQHRVLEDLVDRLDRLGDPGAPAVHRVDYMRRLARAVDEAGWPEARDRVATHPRYRGLRLTPQWGLVPLGPDPGSGLEEFAYLGSGSLPDREPITGRLMHPDDSAIVFVLLPGVTFRMGAQAEDEARENHDPRAHADEGPVHVVEVHPFFLAKYECTQAQWKTLTGGDTPSAFGDAADSPRRPVEQVSWLAAARWMSEHGLRLPTEAEWECACRAGTDTPWWTGDDEQDLDAAAWFAENADGTTYPVGAKAANVWGLHDVHGNVWEWCGDLHRAYGDVGEEQPDSAGERSGLRVMRGGGWSGKAVGARSSLRNGGVTRLRNFLLGLRPARTVFVD